MRFRIDIAKDILTRDNPLRFYTKVVDIDQRLEIRGHKAKDGLKERRKIHINPTTSRHDQYTLRDS